MVNDQGRQLPSKPGDAYVSWNIRQKNKREAVELFDTNTDGYPDSVKTLHKDFMIGNMKEFENREPIIQGQKQFRTYLNELDRRRGTDWKKVYPQMWDLVKDL